MTAFQRWAPPAMVGRLTGVILLASFGSFPASVALAGLVVHHYGASTFFPLAAATVVIALTVGLTQPAWRNFGVEPETGAIPAP